MRRVLFLCVLAMLFVSPAVVHASANGADDSSDPDMLAPVLLIGLLIGAAAVAWWISSRGVESPETQADVEVAEAEPGPEPEPTPVPTPEPEPAPGPDELKLIEGIGPKISGALQDAGVTTFAQLAKTSVERLEQILSDAGVRFIPGAPTTWAEQASLAAAGDREGLERLQDQLKGGRRAE